jgi:chemotaxis protein MotC
VSLGDDMTPRGRAPQLAWLVAAFMAALPFAGYAGQPVEKLDTTLPLYKMVRSLQDVQDQIVGGDLQAADMQRYMLGAIDTRLRSATPQEFDDLRNVDAAMIYAMSGGNPATLDFLISHDARGNFDNRVMNALLLYMGGKGSMATKSLDETVPEYKTTAIGPYLALVAANAIMQKSPDKALKYFDWARLVLPGTIVEEAALRRSLFITVKENDLDKSLKLSRLYLSRFPHSPYAAQVADEFVALVDMDYGKIKNDQIAVILDELDHPRQQEVYLRIARKAAVAGKLDFAKWAAGQAIALDDGTKPAQLKLAKLYQGLSDIPTGDMAETRSTFDQIPDEILGPRERKLRDAGQFILSEVSKPPAPESLTQAEKTNTPPSEPPPAQPAPPAANAANAAGAPAQAAAAGQKQDSPQAAKDPIDAFLTQGQSQLNAIDELIKKGDK